MNDRIATWWACARGALFVVLLVAGTLAGCARSAARGQPTGSAYDPLETVNRKVFWFNDRLDTYVLKPVATGWDYVVPRPAQRSVRNFFANLRFPVVAGNDLLQAKMQKTGVDIARFAVNTTVGVAGFFDPATSWGLDRNDEDLGQTLGYYGCPAGPYLVLPILGPSNPRDTLGLVADSYLAVYPIFVPFVYTASASVVSTVNARALVLGEVSEAQKASVDFYSAVRDAYFQRRQVLINDGAAMSSQEEQELYFLDLDQGGNPGGEGDTKQPKEDESR
jgi:phospholipid-binding lipoprotein MlaA